MFIDYIKNNYRNIIIYVLLIIITITFSYIFSSFFDNNKKISFLPQQAITSTSQSSQCNTILLNLTGHLQIEKNTTNNELVVQDIIDTIDGANNNPSIKAIILEINSTGGSLVPAEMLLQSLKRSDKVTVALILETGTSAAFFAVTGVDIIFASKYSDIGNIGITLSYLDNTDKNKKEGLTFNQISVGRYKDTGNPDKPLTNEDKAIMLDHIQNKYEYMIKDIAENRNMDLEKIRALADGNVFTGEEALKNGLIDKIGGLYEVKEYLKKEIGEYVIPCQ